MGPYNFFKIPPSLLQCIYNPTKYVRTHSTCDLIRFERFILLFYPYIEALQVQK